MANIIEEKSFAFAVRIVNLNKHLNETKKEFVLSKQLLRSGTSKERAGFCFRHHGDESN